MVKEGNHLKIFFILYVGYAKLFGFATFEHPSDTFKRSWIGIFFFFVNLSYASWQIYQMLANKGEEYSSTVGQKYSNYIIMTYLVIVFIAAMIFRMINMVINVVVSRNIFNLISKIEEFDFMVRKTIQ